MKKNKLTERQERFVDHYVDCGNGAEAARKAGYSENADDEIAYENLRKPHIKAAIQERMDQAGITKAKLLQAINEGLEATMVKIATHEGEITDEKSFPDYSIRHRYLETALKLLDAFPASRHHVTTTNEDFFASKSDEELACYIRYGIFPEKKDLEYYAKNNKWPDHFPEPWI